MKKINKHQKVTLNLTAIKLEGSLFLPDQIEKAAHGQSIKQTAEDYQIPRGLKLKEEYSRAFQIALANWKHFATQMQIKEVDAASLTHSFVMQFLQQVMGFAALKPSEGKELNELHYPVSAFADSLAVVIAPFNQSLDEANEAFATSGGGSKKQTPFQLAQRFLNASDEHLWALVTNGRQLRLLRDADTLTRPSYLEIDIEDLLEGVRFSEFQNAWFLLHASRSNGKENCIWEKWRHLGQEEGSRVRDGLRAGVTDALIKLGDGFIAHPDNETLRQALQNGQLTKEAYFQQLLRLIYRFIFLFKVEENDLLQEKKALKAREIYAKGFAMGRLKERCLNHRALNQYFDLWQAVRIVFNGLYEGQEQLALPALGGLFQTSQCADIDKAQLSNRALLLAIKSLRWFSLNNQLAPVDYRNMGPEELGSVYESLLELVPEISLPNRTFGFVGITSEGSTQGNARKTSGSYYTPDELVQELIKSALEPVISQKLKSITDPREAILSIRVIDPACGSGHFLLAAARRLAEELAQRTTIDGAVTEKNYRHALKEVIANCIFGVDRNPMAIELARMALWLEGFEENQALSFLDHHLQVGDALLGVMSWEQLSNGIPKDAFKALSGDDKDVVKALAAQNRNGLKAFKDRHKHPQMSLLPEDTTAVDELKAIEKMPERYPKHIERKEAAYRDFLQRAKDGKLAQAADLFVGAFLIAKDTAENKCPTSETLYRQLFDEYQSELDAVALGNARAACQSAEVFHWPIAFPQVFAKGGFDCVLANPPWERIKLQEEEFFATRYPAIASAKNKAERTKFIGHLSEGGLAQHLYPNEAQSTLLGLSEVELYRDFINAKRTAEATSQYVHVNGEDGGRFLYTGVGDVNTYALFSELISQIIHQNGKAGFIVPTGIATDDSTKAFFGQIATTGKLESLFDFENREGLFAGVHRSYKFCLMTLGKTDEAEFGFFLTNIQHLQDKRRRFRLSPQDFALINPNTGTCPVFRSNQDAELTKKIYRRVPVLIKEAQGTQTEQNPWDISFGTMFHMSNDSHLFKDSPGLVDLPLYEAKMMHQFDHRWASYGIDEKGEKSSSDVTLMDKQNPKYLVTPRYWVSRSDVEAKLKAKNWDKGWLIGWRDITNATNERTLIGTVIPKSGVGNNLPLMFFHEQEDERQFAALCGNLSALVFDFIARHKTGGTHMNYFIYKQLPFLPPETYAEADLAFITPRVLELTYTARDMEPWAQDLGFDGEPFTFDPDRRSILRAELDAYYAKLYGLTKDELLYILDPINTMGEDYPSVTFPGLKNKELKAYGEYRTQRLILEAWDKLESGELA